MTDRRPLIKEIEDLLQTNLEYVQNLLTIQRLMQNDARVTFFKHINIVLDSASTSLILAHKYLDPHGQWWNDIQMEYNRSRRSIYSAFPLVRHKMQLKYFDQTVMNGFFFFIFSSFEHSSRLICKQYNLQLFQTQKKYGISALWKGMTIDLCLKKRDKFIDLITCLRNSFHNNGVFIPSGGVTSRKIVWNNTTYTFNENQPIKDSKRDMWLSFVPISREITNFFESIISSDPVKKFSYYVDPTEPIG